MISVFKSKVLGTKEITPDVKILELSVPGGFEFRPGQYLSLSVLRSDGAKIRKPFSISSSPGRKSRSVEFCAKLIPGGLASEFIRKLKGGEEVELFGPAGKFMSEIDVSGEEGIILAAAGAGVAPFAGAVPFLLGNGYKGKIVLLKSSRTEEGSLYDKEFAALSKKHANFEFHNVFSKPRGKAGNKGHVQDFFEKYIPENFEGDFYLCGLNEMIEDSREKLVSMGFGEGRIHSESFD